MERARYQGADFRKEMLRAFGEIEKSIEDATILDKLRKELNLAT